jgi:hypothetical protein
LHLQLVAKGSRPQKNYPGFHRRLNVENLTTQAHLHPQVAPSAPQPSNSFTSIVMNRLGIHSMGQCALLRKIIQRTRDPHLWVVCGLYSHVPKCNIYTRTDARALARPRHCFQQYQYGARKGVWFPGTYLPHVSRSKD